VDYEDLQQAYERLENRIENLNQLDNIEHLVYATPAIVIGIGVGFLAFGTGSGETQGKENFEPELSEYQEEYVDCPHRHIYICTRMSKLGTETVSYVDSREGRIYLRYAETDRLVARAPQNGTTGYLIRINRNYYTDQETSQTEESSVNETRTDNGNVNDASGEITGGSVENTTEIPNTTLQSNSTTGNQTTNKSTQTT